MTSHDNSSNKLVSIIIPAYNVGMYIDRCITSIFSQEYKNIQVIIAYDEKSTDDTYDRLLALSKKYPLIIDKANDHGSGAARNRGLKLATGEYVSFVDGDDEVLPDFLTTMLSIFEKYTDLNLVFFCGSSHVDNGDVESALKVAASSSHNMGTLSREELLYLKLWHKIPSSPWAYVIKRDFLVENDITFPQYSHAEDSLFTYMLIDKSERVGYTRRKLYLYYQNETSVTHTNPKYWWRKYEPFVYDMIDHFLVSDPLFAEDFKTNTLRIVAYMTAKMLSYPDFLSELERYDIHKLGFLKKNDRLPMICETLCFNLSKRVFWVVVKMINGILSKIYTHPQMQ